ncbi:hypothetical protein [Leptolyngbya sp. FACHB-36]|uniref:hypothetical protein n=1 Tax=Leptolyngbya sp. FACHB-36 TaxID=2692808 RepID=UPI001681BD99|nr:hypothetical protein [Leptolyngbya sp. FACHB-36]
MYCHNTEPDNRFQADAPAGIPVALRVLSSSNQAQEGISEEQGTPLNSLDPLAVYILEAAHRLIPPTGQATIKEFIDEVPAGESAIRDRLNLLVGVGKLSCLPGSGRRPTLYYLSNQAEIPSPSILDNIDLTEDEVLQVVKEKEEALLAGLAEIQKELEVVIQDREALEKAIAVRLKYSVK